MFYVHGTSSKEFNLKSKNITVLNSGDIIEALGDVEITTDNKLKIYSDKSELDKKNSTLKAQGNVNIIDIQNQIDIKSDYVFYDKQKNLIYTKGKTTIILSDIEIISKDVYFDRNKNKIYSENNTNLNDKAGNKMQFDKFTLNLTENLLKVYNFSAIDFDKNKFFLQEAAIDFENKEVVGKDGKVLFHKTLFGNEENDPRMYGRSLIDNKNETILKKGIFTNCKIREKEKCPPWLIKAEEVKHNKKDKKIEYKNAWLSIYDMPVIYFPYFYHPDPTIKRQSGFLLPTFNNSNTLGSSIQIPYFHVISENKDFTSAPRIFFNDKLILQSEYRQANKYSDLIIDHSVARDDSNTINHLFGNYTGNFGNNQFKFNLETTSNKNYLKKYNIQSELVNSLTSLNSFLSVENQTNETYFFSSIEVFEDLTKKDSDSYEFIYPNFNFSQKLNTSLNGSLQFSASGFQKKYETNRYDGVLVNGLEYDSIPIATKKGFLNDYSVIFKNVNTDGENSRNYKNSFDNKLLSKIILNSKFPLRKQNISSTSLLTPTMSLRFSPTETKNIKSQDKRIEYFNLFNKDRIGDEKVLEGGESLTLGANYKYLEKNNNEIVNLSIGQVLRINENQDLPINSTIGQKRSDYIGNLKVSPTQNLNFNYSFSVDNDFNNTNYNLIETQFSSNNFFTSFKFFEKEDNLGEKSYISNTTKLDLDKNHSIGFSTNKNLDINLTEYYDLIYEYKNDCLTAAIEYKKTYYSDVDLKPDENIFFTLTIIPFGNINSPSIN